jgi:hypothetical protein
MADHFNTILPSGVNIASMEFTSNQPTVRTQSLSGRTQVRSFGGQFWTARITMQTMTRSELRKVYGFLVKQKGGFLAPQHKRHWDQHQLKLMMSTSSQQVI